MLSPFLIRVFLIIHVPFSNLCLWNKSGVHPISYRIIVRRLLMHKFELIDIKWFIFLPCILSLIISFAFSSFIETFSKLFSWFNKCSSFFSCRKSLRSFQWVSELVIWLRISFCINGYTLFHFIAHSRIVIFIIAYSTSCLFIVS